MVQLGTLIKVTDLRKVWPKEAYDFTPWLAKEENLKILGNEVGLEIELIETEAKTGSYSTDILAKDTYTDDYIIIENQLEQTDHDHLGKIITYASGHDAKTIIWIVKEAREEHRQAIDWLNEHTDEEINIFLCRIELWKIGDSAIAPKFQIVSSPNNWTKTIKRSMNNEMSSTKMLLYNYWTKLSEEIDRNYPNFNSRKPRSSNFYDIALGSSLAHISLVINTKSEVKCQIWIRDSKPLFDFLYDSKDKIEEELGYELEWARLDDYKSSYIAIINNSDIRDESNWDNLIKWQLNNASKFYDVFSDRVKNFK